MNPSPKKYSQFKAMMAIAAASFRALTRSPSTIAFSFFFPILFLLAFAFLGSGPVKIQVAVASTSDMQSPIFQDIAQSKHVDLQMNTNRNEVENDLLKGNLDAVLDIRKSMKEGKPYYIVNVRTTTASAQKGELFMLILRETVDAVNMKQNVNLQTIAEINPVELAGQQYSTIDFILPGQIGLSVLSTAVFGTAFVFMGLRNTLVIKRFFATPINRVNIILGEAIARLLFSLLGTAFIVILGYYAFNFTLANGVITVINLTLLSGLGLLVFMGLGFMVSSIAKNEAMVPMFSNIIVLPQFVLCGTFFSISLLPVWAQHISALLPLTYLNDALRRVSFEGAGLIDVSKDILILVLWGIGIYAAAAKTFKWE